MQVCAKGSWAWTLFLQPLLNLPELAASCACWPEVLAHDFEHGRSSYSTWLQPSALWRLHAQSDFAGASMTLTMLLDLLSHENLQL